MISMKFTLGGRLLRWLNSGEQSDTHFDGLLTMTAGDGYYLYFEQGNLMWIEVYSLGDTRFPFDPANYLPEQE